MRLLYNSDRWVFTDPLHFSCCIRVLCHHLSLTHFNVLLKGHCHETFDPPGFYSKVNLPYRLLINGLTPFPIWLRILAEIFASTVAIFGFSRVNDTAKTATFYGLTSYFSKGTFTYEIFFFSLKFSLFKRSYGLVRSV
jgi:hypothetical protein